MYNGFILIPSGATLELDYSYAFTNGNGKEEVLNCAETINIECPIDTSNCIRNDSIFCYLTPEINIDSITGKCLFSWEADPSHLVNMEICSDDDNGNITCETYSASSSSVVIETRSFTYSYQIAILNEDSKEWEMVNCEGGEFFCGEKYNCSDVSWSVDNWTNGPSTFDGNSCALIWEAPVHIQGVAGIFFDGNYYKLRISGRSGKLEIPSGVAFNVVFEIDGSICHEAITSTCASPDIPDCDNFSYFLEQNETQNGDCILNWTTDGEPISGTLAYFINGNFSILNIDGENGYALIPNGSQVTAEFYFLNGYNACREIIEINCDTIPLDTIPNDTMDFSFLCDLVTLGFKDANLPGETCYLNWESPDSILLSLEVCHVINGVSNCEVYNSNQGEIELSADDYWLTPTIIYDSPDHGLITLDCDIEEFNCTAIPPNPGDSTSYCSIFSLLKLIAQDSTNSMITFSSLGDNIEDELNNIGFSLDEAMGLVSLIDEVSYEFNFTNVDFTTVETLNGNLYSDEVDEQSFTFYYWVKLLGDLSPVDLEGNLLMDFILKDGTIFSCEVNLIAFFEEEEEPIDTEFPGLPNLECGEDFDSPQSNSTDALLDGEAGDIFYINGFPMVITELSNLGSGNYSGTCIIPVPLQNEPLVTDFSNISVNKDYVVTAGQIQMLADANVLSDIVTMDMPNYVIGGNFCVPSDQNPLQDSTGINVDTGLTDYGFGADSIHIITGTIYDPNGFDISGNYYLTGTPYNEFGCSQTGMTNPDDEPNGIAQPCDPGNPNPGNTTFIENLDPSLTETVTTNITDWIEAIDSTLQTIDCEVYRDSMNTIISTESLDPNIIKGVNSEYFDSGLSQNFTSRPGNVINVSPRNENIILLEKLHQKLYDCDILEINQEMVEGITDDPELLSNISAYIEAEILSWTSYELSLYGDPANFGDWIVSKIQEYLKDNGYIVFEEIPVENYRIEKTYRNSIRDMFDFNHGNYSAALASADMIQVDFDNQRRVELMTEFSQGRREVNGINRGFLLEST